MIRSERIDLTENRDFNDTLRGLLSLDPVAQALPGIYRNRWTGVTVVHSRTPGWKDKFTDPSEGHCFKCGKVLFPWNQSNYQLCPTCGSEVIAEPRLKDYPWGELDLPQPIGPERFLFELK